MMFNSLNRLLPLAAVLAFALPSIGLGQQKVLNLYSSRHYETDEALYSDFTRKTGIRINRIEGGEDALIERIRNEGARSPADVMITVDAGRLWRAEEEGIFQGIESDVLAERLPEAMRHPEGKWFGFSQRVRAIFYNPENIDPSEITSYEDLTDSRFAGEVCIRSSNNIYNQSLLAMMIEHHGAAGAEEWAQGMVNNFARPPEGGDTDQIRAVASGECDLAVANHYYYVRLLNSDDAAEREAAEKVGILFPNQNGHGIHVNIGGAGVVEGAPNRENAIRFLEYLASDEAQEIFAAGNYEYPVVDGVTMDAALESWGEFKKDNLNVSVLGENNPEAIRIFDRVGWR